MNYISNFADSCGSSFYANAFVGVTAVFAPRVIQSASVALLSTQCTAVAATAFSFAITGLATPAVLMLAAKGGEQSWLATKWGCKFASDQVREFFRKDEDQVNAKEVNLEEMEEDLIELNEAIEENNAALDLVKDEWNEIRVALNKNFDAGQLN